MSMSYSMLSRYLERADEVSRMPEVPPPVVRLHAERLAPVARAFRVADDALVEADAAATKERGESTAALERIAGPYKLVRTLVRARDASVDLPEALGSLRTDTDKKLAIGELLARVERSRGEGWADELLDGEFARLAPEVIREIDESVLASASRKRAVDARAAAYGPAYEQLLSFKAAVLAGMGPASAAYRRLSFRGRAGDGDEGPGGVAGDGGVVA